MTVPVGIRVVPQPDPGIRPRHLSHVRPHGSIQLGLVVETGGEGDGAGHGPGGREVRVVRPWSCVKVELRQKSVRRVG
jgi:hypothetical protein